MNKFVLFLLSITIFFISSSYGAVYKGQREFVRKCAICHKKKLEFIQSRTIMQWEELTEDSGEKLANIHLKSDKAKESLSYFKSKKYTKKSKHLKQFLVEYAKDSGNVKNTIKCSSKTFQIVF